MKTTILLANNNSVVSETISTLLSVRPEYEIIGVCNNGAAAEQLLMLHNPAIAIVDEDLAIYCGLTVTQQMRAAGLSTKFALITQYGNTTRMRKAVECGVLGYFAQQHLSKHLLACVDTLSANNYYIDNDFFLSKPSREIKYQAR